MLHALCYCLFMLDLKIVNNIYIYIYAWHFFFFDKNTLKIYGA